MNNYLNHYINDLEVLGFKELKHDKVVKYKLDSSNIMALTYECQKEKDAIGVALRVILRYDDDYHVKSFDKAYIENISYDDCIFALARLGFTPYSQMSNLIINHEKAKIK